LSVLHHRSDKSLAELAETYNPCIRGWIDYYIHFLSDAVTSDPAENDAYVIRWARRKYKWLRHQTKGARDWFVQLRRANPTLSSLAAMSWQRPNIGSRAT
jgi:RNA-directed DNA polymerase